MKIDKDWSLVQRARQGDEYAFSKLHEKYHRKIFGFARKYIGDEHHADDVVQEVFMQVFRKLDSFRGEAQFSTWLFRISINACKSKRQKIDRQRRIQEEQLVKNAPTSDLATPERCLGNQELRAQIERSLQTLTAEQRQILVLKTVQKLSYTEIGEALNQSENQIRGKLYRARKAFRMTHEGGRIAA